MVGVSSTSKIRYTGTIVLIVNYFLIMLVSIDPEVVLIYFGEGLVSLMACRIRGSSGKNLGNVGLWFARRYIHWAATSNGLLHSLIDVNR